MRYHSKAKKKTVVLLDTNILLIPGQFRVDIFAEIERIIEEPYELAVYRGTLEELQRIMERGRGRSHAAARLGKALLAARKVRTLEKRKGPSETLLNTDRFIADFAARNACVVATLDRELQKKILEQGGRCIALRGKDHLVIRD